MVVSVKAKQIVKAQRKHRKYPWKRWFAKGRFTLIRGRDYDHKTMTMIQMVRNVAYRGSCGVRACHVTITGPSDERSFTVKVVKYKGE